MTTVFDVVFEGGGAKGIALSGAVAALEARGIGIRRFLGTSAGAITAANLAVGYTGQDILQGSLVKTPQGKPIYTTFSDGPKDLTEAQLLDSGLGQLLGKVDLPLIPLKAEQRIDAVVLRSLDRLPGMRTVFSVMELGGMNAGDGFLDWMQKSLEAKGTGFGTATFAELFEQTGRDLSVVATDTTDRSQLVLNHRTAPGVPVSWGVRMSMSIPFFFVPAHWDAAWGPYLGQDIAGHEIVDGGVVSNFPLRLFTDADTDEVIAWMGPPPDPVRILGLYLDANLEVPGAGPGTPATHDHARLVERIEGLVDTMMGAVDNSVLTTHADLVCRLPVKGYGTTDFNVSEARVRALFNAGTAACDAYLDAHGF
ncbi:MAG: patatin-like phospholipase family protein [Alphaproteobacteria bacterium]|nr:patatin-like phospholipase family protein [Alphaproteobacteria bacterium]